MHYQLSYSGLDNIIEGLSSIRIHPFHCFKAALKCSTKLEKYCKIILLANNYFRSHETENTYFRSEDCYKAIYGIKDRLRLVIQVMVHTKQWAKMKCFILTWGQMAKIHCLILLTMSIIIYDHNSIFFYESTWMFKTFTTVVYLWLSYLLTFTVCLSFVLL